MVSSTHAPSATRPVVAFGPELPGVGSWDWVGGELSAALEDRFDIFDILRFQEQIPDCDAVVIVKYKPPLDELLRASERSAVLFCPIDAYGSAADIDADYLLLRSCRRIILHAPSLAKYFQSYAPVTTLDHHINYVAPLREKYRPDGPIMWTGLRGNLPPLVNWVNTHGLPAELEILTNLEDGETTDPQSFGFHGPTAVRIRPWSAERHRASLSTARGAIDVKGDDFRQRHKPPAKALDCIASGVPLAMNGDSSSAGYLRNLGFEIARPENPDHWLSEDYWRKTRALGKELRSRLSLDQIASQLAAIINETIKERAACPA